MEHEWGPYAVADGNRQGLLSARGTYPGASRSAGALRRASLMKRDIRMDWRGGNFLLWAVLAAAAATPALGRDAAPGASVPDMSRLWGNTLGPGFPPPTSGPGPVTNTVRVKQAV